ncbi:sigma 54-interacting transcriptional regulator [Fusibacter sp. JL216-2]|uniref:sigma 54-interacting transcriptional regulator n=1 Tax=Fusibacter sp. JL216-2 TaxID=3071453 RepID=UPI003D332F8E
MFFTRQPLVESVMSKMMPKIYEQGSIYEALTYMLHSGTTDIFVTDKDDVIIGLITMTDISRMVRNDEGLDLPVWMKMRKNMITIEVGTSILTARDLMIKNNVGRVPVVRDGRICGVIRNNEIMKHFYMNMEESWKRLNIFIDSLHESVCVVDAVGEVVIWNKQSEELYGLSADEVIGKPLSTYFPDALILQVLKTKTDHDSVCHEPRPNYQVAISASPLFADDGTFIGAISSERDISEVKQLSDELSRMNETVHYLEKMVDSIGENVFGTIIGTSPVIKESIELSKRVAKSTASILIRGESGTGKEVFARAIYKESGCEGLFIPVNCSAVPDQLFESEFFGYESGAFTGASKKGKMGIFELANNGVVFLDEIADLPMHMQAKLLRVLQEGEVRRVGAEKNREINCRIISATNKDLKKMVIDGTFREDLYFRLNVIQLSLPPLRERKEDIEVLAYSFLKEISQKNKMQMPIIEDGVIEALQSYEWKGNIRELKNIVESMTVLSENGKITIDSVPKYILKDVDPSEFTHTVLLDDDMDLIKKIERVEKQTIEKALELSGGKKAKAAKLLKIPRSTLYYKIEQYNIDV